MLRTSLTKTVLRLEILHEMSKTRGKRRRSTDDDFVDNEWVPGCIVEPRIALQGNLDTFSLQLGGYSFVYVRMLIHINPGAHSYTSRYAFIYIRVLIHVQPETHSYTSEYLLIYIRIFIHIGSLQSPTNAAIDKTYETLADSDAIEYVQGDTEVGSY